MWNVWFVMMNLEDGQGQLWKPFIHPNRRPPDKWIVYWIDVMMGAGLSLPEWIVWSGVQPYV
jgi:hypothetical protein